MSDTVLQYIKYKGFWKVIDKDGNSASGKTKEDALRVYELTYQHLTKINFNPKNILD